MENREEMQYTINKAKEVRLTDGLANGVCCVVYYNSKFSTKETINPYEVFADEPRELVADWVNRSQKLFKWDNPVADAFLDTINESCYDNIRNKFNSTFAAQSFECIQAWFNKVKIYLDEGYSIGDAAVGAIIVGKNEDFEPARQTNFFFAIVDKMNRITQEQIKNSTELIRRLKEISKCIKTGAKYEGAMDDSTIDWYSELKKASGDYEYSRYTLNGIFNRESLEFKQEWIARIQELLTKQYSVGDVIIGSLFACRNTKFEALKNKFIAANPGFNKSSYWDAINYSCWYLR